MQKKSKLLLLTALLAVVFTIVFVFRPQALEVEIATVERRPFAATVEDQGRTRGRKPFLVTSPIAGRLLRSEYIEGDRVSQGQVVARVALLPQDQRSLGISQANLAAAQARHSSSLAALDEFRSVLSQARVELERREELAKNNLASTEEVENHRQIVIVAEARVINAQASVEAAIADVASARSLLMGTDDSNDRSDQGIEEILAPTDGTIYKVLEENERVIQAGTALFEISNNDTLEVVVDMLTQDAVKVSAGNPIQLSGWGGDYTIEGVVRYVEPEAFTKISALGVEEQRVNIIADLENAPASLGAEYRLQAAIIFWQSDDELSIPSSAIFQRASGWNTFVITDGKVQLRSLEIGYRERDYTQVLSGVDAGETVILFPSELIAEGVRVKLP